MSYKRIKSAEELADAIARLKDSWKAEGMPESQWRNNKSTYEGFVRGDYKHWDSVSVFFKVIERTGILKGQKAKILEVGAGNALYARLLEREGYVWEYTGTDYSLAFQKFAKELMPHIQYDVAEGEALPYKDKEFDIVVSGSHLLHMPNWTRGLAEMARVSKRYVIAHRLPLLDQGSTAWFTKDAYGFETIEAWFGRKEFYEIAGRNNLELIAEFEIKSTRTEDCGGMAQHTVVFEVK